MRNKKFNIDQWHKNNERLARKVFEDFKKDHTEEIQNEKMMNKDDICINCGLPRSIYALKIEPGIANPDYKMPNSCVYGHTWKNETMDIIKKWRKRCLNG